MRKIIFVSIFIFILAGCIWQPISSNYNLQHPPMASRQESIDSTSTYIPTMLEKAKLSLDPTGIPPLVKNGISYSQSNVNMSESAYVLLGQQARGQVILPRVPLVSQQDFTSCGEAAFAMGWNYRHPDQVLDIGMVETQGLKRAVYYPAGSPHPRGYLGTSPSGMVVIGDYYASENNQPAPTTGNIDLDNGGAFARLEAKGLLYSQLSAGNPVIIEVTDSIGKPSQSYNDSHYVIVTGMNFDAGIVTYNDPLVSLSMSGKYSGYDRSAEWSQVWNSWFNNKDINPGQGGHPGRGWYMVVN
jgi:hypothetical protein